MRKFLSLRTVILAVIAAVFLAGLILWLTRIKSSGEEFSEQPTNTQNHNAEDDTSSIDENLQNMITTWAEGQPGEYAVVVRELEGQKRIARYRADAQMVPASVYKLFLVYAVLDNVQKEELTLDHHLPSGVTVDECIESLLVVSSDVCVWELGNTIGWEQIDSFLHRRGFAKTTINNYNQPGDFIKDKLTTARDTEKLLTSLESGALLNEELRNYMLAFMERQVHRERIPSGVPEEVSVADKAGWLDGIENDAGIVGAPTGKYVLVILSAEGATPEQLAELSSLIYNHMTGGER